MAKVKVGDIIKITDGCSTVREYIERAEVLSVDGRGCIARVKDLSDNEEYNYCGDCSSIEYEVIEGKSAEAKAEHRFKVGDIVKGNAKNRYGVTNSNMTKAKVIEVSADGKYISVEIIDHKYGETGKFTRLHADWFDLVEEVKSQPKQNKPQFKVGDKVVPSKKSAGVSLESDLNWINNGGKTQGFMYITDIEFSSQYETEYFYSLYHRQGGAGNHYLEGDFTLFGKPEIDNDPFVTFPEIVVNRVI